MNKNLKVGLPRPQYGWKIFIIFSGDFWAELLSKTLDKKNRPRVLLALCIHIDSYLAYICAERDFLIYALRYCIKASLMTFLVENDVFSLKIIQIQNFIDNNVS